MENIPSIIGSIERYVGMGVQAAAGFGNFRRGRRGIFGGIGTDGGRFAVSRPAEQEGNDKGAGTSLG